MNVDWRDVRAVGFGLLVTGLSVAYLANTGKITGGVMMIVGATVLIAGLVAKQRPTN